VNEKWYVLQVMTGDEVAIRNVIENKIGVKALVPRRTICERYQGKIRPVIKTLIPSYVFVQIYLEPKVYYKLRSIVGVIRFLGGFGPEPVPNYEMNYMLRLCGDGEIAGLSTLSIGDGVRVMAGPLRGMEGQIIKIDRRKLRAKVRLTLLGRPHEVDMGIEVLENETQTEFGKAMDAPGMEVAAGV
jgi:transcriptional antiterminator NusG